MAIPTTGDQSRMNVDPDRGSPYKLYRFDKQFFPRTETHGFVQDVDQLEYDFDSNGQRVVVGVLETSLIGTPDKPYISGAGGMAQSVEEASRYLAAVRKRRRQQMIVSADVAQMYQERQGFNVPAVYLMHSRDMEQMFCLDMKCVDSENINWIKTNKWQWANFIQRMHATGQNHGR